MSENFIRVYEKTVSREFTNGIIDYFEWCLQNNKYWDRSSESTGLRKKDLASTLDPLNHWDINFTYEHLSGYIKEFNSVFWDVCYKDYIQQFDILNNFDRHTICSYKIQKTKPGEGYHVWHSESGNVSFNRRIAVYILYLNSVAEGGETEFLYQNLRVPPVEGSLVIFPSAFTHVHRGNPPLKGVKYIMTGWIEFA